MKRIDIASRLARQRKISRSRAADCVDRVVHEILRKLRCGESADLPGLGRLEPGRPVRLRLIQRGSGRGVTKRK